MFSPAALLQTASISLKCLYCQKVTFFPCIYGPNLFFTHTKAKNIQSAKNKNKKGSQEEDLLVHRQHEQQDLME